MERRINYLPIKFFELYEKHSRLWDVFSITYKDRIAQEDAYREIENAMNFELVEVKAKKRLIILILFYKHKA